MGLLSQQRGALLAHCVIERAGIHELIEEWAADGPSAGDSEQVLKESPGFFDTVPSLLVFIVGTPTSSNGPKGSAVSLAQIQMFGVPMWSPKTWIIARLGLRLGHPLARY
jgi:hypothetical protein